MATSDFILSTTDLHSLFDYIDGDLYWKISVKLRGTAKPGQKAGTTHKNGYKSVRVKDVMLKQHRVIFFMFHGFAPKTIDHIDGNPRNNKIDNLRQATASQNMMNSRIAKNSTSGIKGVFWHKNKNKWIASCSNEGKLFHLGYFEDKNLAEVAVKKFRETHHGIFANHG